MTTINILTLKAARLVTTVHDSVATSGTVSTVGDTKLTENAGTYNGGTVWFTSGSNVGGVSVVKTHGQNNLTLDGTMPYAINSGDKYSVADNKFPLWEINQAVNQALQKVDIPASGSGVATSGSLVLPAGVNNVMQVQINGEDNYHWEEQNGVINFDTTSRAGTCTFQYLTPASEYPTLATAVPDSVDPEYIAWAAVVNLWRQYIQRIGKDNPTAVDMLNEAKTEEAASLARMRRSGPAKLQKAPHYSKWTAS